LIYFRIVMTINHNVHNVSITIDSNVNVHRKL